jgi:hypothetical protein
MLVDSVEAIHEESKMNAPDTMKAAMDAAKIKRSKILTAFQRGETKLLKSLFNSIGKTEITINIF